MHKPDADVSKQPVASAPADEPGVWSLPAAYQADESELRRSEGPAVILRTADKVRFNRFAPGIYLADGYAPKDADDLVNGFPRIIVRKTDGVQFVLIAGGPYQQGDFRPGTPISDGRNNPCTPHPAQVADFYLQETEVTNAEIQDFNEPDARRDRWRKALELTVGQVKNEKAALKYPAVCLNWATAQSTRRAWRAVCPPKPNGNTRLVHRVRIGAWVSEACSRRGSSQKRTCWTTGLARQFRSSRSRTTRPISMSLT